MRSCDAACFYDVFCAFRRGAEFGDIAVHRRCGRDLCLSLIHILDGVTHALPRPFIVIATQNPAGASGTQLLPDSQLDRFMVKLSLGYPEPQDELRMLRRKQKGNPLDGVQQALDKAGLAALRAQTDQVYVSDEVLDYIVRLVAGTRTLPELVQGASPRATLAVAAMAKAAALARRCV